MIIGGKKMAFQITKFRETNRNNGFTYYNGRFTKIKNTIDRIERMSDIAGELGMLETTCNILQPLVELSGAVNVDKFSAAFILIRSQVFESEKHLSLITQLKSENNLSVESFNFHKLTYEMRLENAVKFGISNCGRYRFYQDKISEIPVLLFKDNMQSVEKYLDPAVKEISVNQWGRTNLHIFDNIDVIQKYYSQEGDQDGVYIGRSDETKDGFTLPVNLELFKKSETVRYAKKTGIKEEELLAAIIFHGICKINRQYSSPEERWVTAFLGLEPSDELYKNRFALGKQLCDMESIIEEISFVAKNWQGLLPLKWENDHLFSVYQIGKKIIRDVNSGLEDHECFNMVAARMEKQFDTLKLLFENSDLFKDSKTINPVKNKYIQYDLFSENQDI